MDYIEFRLTKNSKIISFYKKDTKVIFFSLKGTKEIFSLLKKMDISPKIIISNSYKSLRYYNIKKYIEDNKNTMISKKQKKKKNKSTIAITSSIMALLLFLNSIKTSYNEQKKEIQPSTSVTKLDTIYMKKEENNNIEKNKTLTLKNENIIS